MCGKLVAKLLVVACHRMKTGTPFDPDAFLAGRTGRPSTGSDNVVRRESPNDNVEAPTSGGTILGLSAGSASLDEGW